MSTSDQDRNNKNYREGYDDGRNPDHFKNTVGRGVFGIKGDENYEAGFRQGQKDREEYGRSDSLRSSEQPRRKIKKERRAKQKPHRVSTSYSGGSFRSDLKQNAISILIISPYVIWVAYMVLSGKWDEASLLMQVLMVPGVIMILFLTAIVAIISIPFLIIGAILGF
jgi:hypothetical protein